MLNCISAEMAKPLEEETLSALTYKTWVLKVSIHCEGCNKKVKKVLQSIDGVYTTTVDSQQHKVHVTGNVEAETLIRKLLKAGKHATLWPEEPKKNNTEKPQKKGDLVNGGEPGGEKTSEETNIKTDEVTANAKSSKNNTEGEKTTEALGGDESSSVDKKGQSSEPVAAKNEGGNNASKKKKKKGKNSNSDKKEGGEKSSDSDPADVLAAPPTKAPQTPLPVDLSPPNKHIYPSYVPMHYAPMAYTMSYNTSYSMPNASHYAPPAPASGGYVLLHPRSYAPQMLSDKACIQNEDSNDYGAGCSIM